MSKSLHDEIMNLPCKRTMSHCLNHEEMQLYKEGHRDARHAAAELVITADDLQAELNAARALLREVIADAGIASHIDACHRAQVYLDACDKPGEPT